MDQIQKLTKQFSRFLTVLFVFISLVSILLSSLIHYFTGIDTVLSAVIVLCFSLALSVALAPMAASYITKPMSVLAQAILHITPEETSAPAPDITTLGIGRKLVTQLVTQVYNFATQQDGSALENHRNSIIQSSAIVTHLPLPLFVFNKQQIVVNASAAGLAYCNIKSSQLFGKPLNENINLEFSNENTLEKWIQDCQKDKATDEAYWDRVRVSQPDTELRQCDIYAYYNRDNPSGTEFIITMFDRTKQYTQDDDNISFISLAVHELRTPLTMLRGYIEVFHDELEGKLDTELTDFMQKMIVSAQQLGAFFNNILNVARVEQNQLVLSMSENNWSEVLTDACADLAMKAKVHGKSLNLNISADLPLVAIDHVSIVEVINNLVDNALKYSQKGEAIAIDAHLRKDGFIETTIQDHGEGVPSGMVPHLFDKFYRNHRTSGSVGGTGLGLYISKAIVTAHGGEIWVQSKEGEGATFGFTLLPASKLAEELKSSDNGTIVRNAHGWIKNHSLYRR